MKLSEAFPSNYIKATELDGQDWTLTIKSVKQETIGQGRDADTKLVLTFSNHDKGLVLNKTNANTIAKVLGSDDTDDWIGKAITIYPTEVEYAGETVLGLRVRLMSRPATRPVTATSYESLPANPGVAKKPDTAAADALKAVKIQALEAMTEKMPGEPKEAIYAALKTAREQFYPGRAQESIGAAEWRKMIEMDFKAEEVKKPYAEDEAAFADDDIPF